MHLRYAGRIGLSHSYCCRPCCCTCSAANLLACFLAGQGLGSGGGAQLGREEESSARTPEYKLYNLRREPRFCFVTRVWRAFKWEEGGRSAEINDTTEQRFSFKLNL